jgi:hypothetical protein
MALLLGHSSLSEDVRFYVSFHVSTITLLTLILNGTTITAFYKAIQVYPAKPKDEKLMFENIHHIEHHGAETYESLKQHWLFCDLDKELMKTMFPSLEAFMPTLMSDTAAAVKAVQSQTEKVAEALKERKVAPVKSGARASEGSAHAFSGLQKALTKAQIEARVLSIEDKIALQSWQTASGRAMKFNPFLPGAKPTLNLETQLRRHVNHRLKKGHLQKPYAGELMLDQAASPLGKFRVAAKLIRAECVEARAMILDFAHEAA